MKDMLIDRGLKVLAIVALIMLIICSLSWLSERPNRYQLAMTGEGLLRLDTCTGILEQVIPPYKITFHLTEYKK